MLYKDIVKSLALVLSLFEGRERSKLFLLLIGMFFMGLLEVVGVASITPFIAVVANPEIIHENSYLKFIYDYFNFDNENSFLQGLGLFALFLVIFSNMFSAFINWQIVSFSRNQAHIVASKLLGNYLFQPYLFFTGKNTADLAKNILSEVDRTINGLVLPGLMGISRAAIAVFILIFVLYISPILALISFTVLGGVYGFIFILIKKRLHAYGTSTSECDEKRYKVANESMTGIKELKLHHMESTFLEQFKIPSKNRAKLMTYSQLASILPRYLLDTIAFGAIILMITIMVGLGKESYEIIPIVTIFAFAGYRLLPALQQIYASSSQVKFNFPALNILVKDFSEVALVASKSKDNFKPMRFSKKIRIQNLYFSYPEIQSSVLSNVNLEIDINTTVGFVGATGSGKTTLIDILLGLLSPRSGQIVVDDVILNENNISEWQQIIGYVPQDIFLIDDTIELNIAFGINNPDFTRLKNAAFLAGLDDFINGLPEGYQTMVGERGVRLSGGQRQRIAIARALYNNPKILIFDEATSSLDVETENVIMNAISSLAHKKTILMIAHRLTTLKDCDKIYLLENNTIKPPVTYSELL